jgi:hypothetical protein
MGYWEQIAVENIRHEERRAKMSLARRVLFDFCSAVGWVLLGFLAYLPVWLPVLLLVRSWMLSH